MLLRIEGRTGPLHVRVYEAVREAVLAGRLQAGERMPSTRALAAELGISRTVTLQAYDRLLSEGVLESRRGSGSYVAEGVPRGGWPIRRGAGRSRTVPAEVEPAAASDVVVRAPRLSRQVKALLPFSEPAVPAGAPALDFRYGQADRESFPARTWRRLLSREAARPVMAYGDARGSRRLREALASYLGRSRGVRCTAEDVVVVTGSQQALYLTARVLLDPGDRVLLEEPHYQGARQAFLAAGARVSVVPADGEGIRTDALPRGVEAPRLACVTPSHQFPLGGVLPLGRRLALLGWAHDVDAMILEDDYDGEFRYDAPPVEAIQALDREGRVVYGGTFSKVLFPALRLGYLVVPSGLAEAYRAAKWTCDRHSPSLEQEALAGFLEEGHFERHLRRARKRYAARRAALLEALRKMLGARVTIEGHAAGLHVVVWLAEFDAAGLGRVVAEAARRGVGVYPVAPYYLGNPPGAGLLLGYSALPEDAIREGVARLADALTAALS